MNEELANLYLPRVSCLRLARLRAFSIYSLADFIRLPSTKRSWRMVFSISSWELLQFGPSELNLVPICYLNFLRLFWRSAETPPYDPPSYPKNIRRISYSSPSLRPGCYLRSLLNSKISFSTRIERASSFLNEAESCVGTTTGLFTTFSTILSVGTVRMR